MLVQVEERAKLAISSKLSLSKKTKDELKELTEEQGEERRVPDTFATVRTFKSHCSYGIKVSNASGPIEQTVDLILKFTKVNYRVEGEDESVTEVRRVL